MSGPKGWVGTALAPSDGCPCEELCTRACVLKSSTCSQRKSTACPPSLPAQRDRPAHTNESRTTHLPPHQSTLGRSAPLPTPPPTPYAASPYPGHNHAQPSTRNRRQTTTAPHKRAAASCCQQRRSGSYQTNTAGSPGRTISMPGCCCPRAAAGAVTCAPGLLPPAAAGAPTGTYAPAPPCWPGSGPQHRGLCRRSAAPSWARAAAC